MSKTQKVQITERAAFQRIARRLAGDGSRLLACRENTRAFQDLGRWYVVSDRNAVSRTHVNLQKLGRELGAIHPWEEIEAEPLVQPVALDRNGVLRAIGEPRKRRARSTPRSTWNAGGDRQSGR